MRVDPKALVRRLTPTATRMLEAAVARAASSRQYEIGPEHLLLAMLEVPESEPTRIVTHFEGDAARLAGRLQKIVAGLRSGNPGRPVFADSLFDWFENAWLLGSVEYGEVRLRSGVLLVELASRTSHYTGESLPEIEAIRADELRRNLGAIVGSSDEAPEALPETGGSGPASTEARPGSTEALERFTVNFTARARGGELDRIFGRDGEIRQLVDILARRRKNNPIVVGEPGVGKTALVEGLAQAIVDGSVPDVLKDVDLLGLDLGALQAGASVKGELENRLKAVLGEVKASPRPIVLFIDEAHTLIGAGGAAGTGDVANLLKPALARGELRTVAATTFAEYKKYFEKDAALERRFQPVKVDEPSEENAILMLRGLRPVYEAAHKVPIRDEAVEAAVRLSHRYISGRLLPDKAIDLLDTSAARVRVEGHARPEKLVALESELAALERQRDVLTRDQKEGHAIEDGVLEHIAERLEKVKAERAALAQRWDQEVAAVKTVREARQAAGEEAGDASGVSEALGKLRELQGEEPLVHVDVDADVVAQVVASWTGIPAGKMKSDAITAALGLEDRLRQRVRGQEAAIQTVAETIRIARAGIRDPRTPVGVLLFVGPSGVGKTETALALADTLYGGERFLITINMSEFQEKHTVSRLIGSPPGYVGYGEGGILTEAVRQRPYSVVLLDECEKADLEVMNLFYQVFDKGTLSDGEGRLVDFRNTVVILTSNLATDELVKIHEADEPPATDEVVQKIQPVLSAHFKPALLARMSVVPFAPLGRDIIRDIATSKLGALKSRLERAHGIETTFDDALVDELTERSLVTESGARTVDHTLRRSLMPLVSTAILEQMAAGDLPSRMHVGLSPSGKWRVELED